METEFEYGYEDEFKNCLCFGHQFNLQDEIHVITDKVPMPNTRKALISKQPMKFQDCRDSCRANDFKAFEG